MTTSTETPTETPMAAIMAEDALAAKQKMPTEKEYRQLRRAYFTVRHDRVNTCGHKLDRLNEPRTNCEFCWFAWLNAHGELVQTTDKAFQEQGPAFLDKMRGKRYRKYFVRFMATLARLQQEQNALQKQTDRETKATGALSEESRAPSPENEGILPEQQRDDKSVCQELENSEPGEGSAV